MEMGVEEESPDLAELIVNNASYAGRRLTTDVKSPRQDRKSRVLQFLERRS